MIERTTEKKQHSTQKIKMLKFKCDNVAKFFFRIHLPDVVVIIIIIINIMIFVVSFNSRQFFASSPHSIFLVCERAHLLIHSPNNSAHHKYALTLVLTEHGVLTEIREEKTTHTHSPNSYSFIYIDFYIYPYSSLFKLFGIILRKIHTNTHAK